MRITVPVASLLLFIALSACAAVYTPRQPMPIDEVVRLSKSSTPPQEIIARIRSSGTAYALRGSDFAKLKAAGVADPVLDYLQQSFVDDLDLLTRYWVLGENLGGCRFCYPQPVDVDNMRSGYDIPGAPSPTRYQLNKPAGTPDWVPVPLAPGHQRLSVERVVELSKSGTPQSDLVNQILHSRMDHVVGVGGIGTIRTRPAAGLEGSRLAHLRDEGLSDPVLDALQAQFLGQFIEAERLRYQNWGKGPGSNR